MTTRLAPLLALALLFAVAPAAHAVWGGDVDTTHPQVGAFYFDGNHDGDLAPDEIGCSGSYVGRSKDNLADVFLTAGHCIPPAELRSEFPPEDFYVSFDNDANDGVDDPIQLTDYVQMPGFGLGRGDPHDIGLMFMPAGSVGSLTPVELPPADFLDTLKTAGELNFLHADIVGYGATPVWDEPGRTFYDFTFTRHAGTAVVTGLSKSKLVFNQNVHGNGTGSGLCIGDSGSPQLVEGTLQMLSITEGGNLQCNSRVADYRLDTPVARDFLDDYLNLP
ncbi:MAG TPA: hypothetical protein VH247_10465 [Thermoleophilaceae bacterium]|jgi:hypothetical protein|nr:hypothetical protein [Thermoleophilaceae bacterium]